MALATQINDVASTATPSQLAEAQAVVEASVTAEQLTIDQKKQALRAADCLYDKEEVWKQLGAAEVPLIPDAVIEEAYEKGGRVILRCSSMSDQVDAVRRAGGKVEFANGEEPSHYTEHVSNPEWIVVPSYIHFDKETRFAPKKKEEVITNDNPAPTPEDWFASIAYARLDGNRQPKGCEGLYAFTTAEHTKVGSVNIHGITIHVDRIGAFGRRGGVVCGAACFGRPQNSET